MKPKTKYWPNFKRELNENLDKVKEEGKLENEIVELMKHMLENTRLRIRH